MFYIEYRTNPPQIIQLSIFYFSVTFPFIVITVDCIKSERASPEHISAVNDISNTACLIERNSTRDETSPMNLDNYFFVSAAGSGGGTSISNKFEAVSANIRGTGGSIPASSCLPSVIYKCSNCDFFSQSKQEMEHHIEELHPNSTEPDFISIPTNAAAIHAFQAAVVAATAAAAAAATRDRAISPTTQKSNQNDGDGDECPVAIKKERLEELVDDADEDKEGTALTHMEVEQQTTNQQEATTIESNTPVNVGVTSVQCPLCQDDFTEKQLLELHLMGVHSVSRDGLARLLQLVDTSGWQNVPMLKMPKSLTAAAAKSHSSSNSDIATVEQQTVVTSTSASVQNVEQSIHVAAELNCQQCGSSFKLQQQLLIHAQDTQHYPMQHGEYQCLVSKQCPLLFNTVSAMIAHYKDTHMNLVISERHVYKYRCKQCSLAFKTQEKLSTHTLYHTMRDATKCGLCQRNFRSTQSLQKHMDQVHNSNQSSQQLSPENIGPLQQAVGCKSPMTSPSSSSGIMANIPEVNAAATATSATGRGDDGPLSQLDTGMHFNIIGHDVTLKRFQVNDISIVEAAAIATATASTDEVVVEGRRELVRNPIYDLLHDRHGTQLQSTTYAIKATESINSVQIYKASGLDLTSIRSVSAQLASTGDKKDYDIHDPLHDMPGTQHQPTAYTDKATESSNSVQIYESSGLDSTSTAKESISVQLASTDDKKAVTYSSGRPFKCNICRMGFTQKNILLVHLKSVSHLHKAKKVFNNDEFGKKILNRRRKSDFSNIDAVLPIPSDFAYTKTDSFMKTEKPYKCSICRVSFAQESTLDIHLRSVLHQMRSTKQQHKLEVRQTTQQNFGAINFKHPVDTRCTMNCNCCHKKFSSHFFLNLHLQKVHKQLELFPAATEATSICASSLLQNLNNSCSTSFDITDHLWLQNLNAAPIAYHNTNISNNLETFPIPQQTNNPYFLNLGQKNNSEDSPAMSPVQHGESALDTKKSSPMDSNTSHQTTTSSPALSMHQHQQQHVAAIAALLRQQQQQRSADAAADRSSPDAVMQQLQMEPAMLAQKIMEQNLQQAAVHFPNLTPQNLQSLQNLQNLQQMQQMQQQLPQMAAAAAATGMNPVDMLNLMQFHHLMSLNFMNLAPPLIFGGGSAAANATGSTGAGTAGGVTATAASNVSATLGGSNVLSTPNANSCIVVGSNTTSGSGTGTGSSGGISAADGTAAQLLQQQVSPVAAAAAAAATQV